VIIFSELQRFPHQKYFPPFTVPPSVGQKWAQNTILNFFSEGSGLRSEEFGDQTMNDFVSCTLDAGVEKGDLNLRSVTWKH
jgi:hypothetical protein